MSDCLECKHSYFNCVTSDVVRVSDFNGVPFTAVDNSAFNKLICSKTNESLRFVTDDDEDHYAEWTNNTGKCEYYEEEGK